MNSDIIEYQRDKSKLICLYNEIVNQLNMVAKNIKINPENYELWDSKKPPKQRLAEQMMTFPYYEKINTQSYHMAVKDAEKLVSALVLRLNNIGECIGEFLPIDITQYKVFHHGISDTQYAIENIIERMMSCYNVWNNDIEIMKIMLSFNDKYKNYTLSGITDIEVIIEDYELEDYYEMNTSEPITLEELTLLLKTLSPYKDRIFEMVRQEQDLYHNFKPILMKNKDLPDERLNNSMRKFIAFIDDNKSQIFKHGMINLSYYNKIKKENIIETRYQLGIKIWYYFSVFLDEISHKDRSLFIRLLNVFFYNSTSPDVRIVYLLLKSVCPWKSTEGMPSREMVLKDILPTEDFISSESLSVPSIEISYKDTLLKDILSFLNSIFI